MHELSIRSSFMHAVLDFHERPRLEVERTARGDRAAGIQACCTPSISNRKGDMVNLPWQCLLNGAYSLIYTLGNSPIYAFDDSASPKSNRSDRQYRCHDPGGSIAGHRHCQLRIHLIRNHHHIR